MSSSDSGTVEAGGSADFTGQNSWRDTANDSFQGGSDKHEIEAELEAFCRHLLVEAGADRVTLRIDDPARGLHVDRVACEAVRPGIRAIGGDVSIRQRQLQTIAWIDRWRRPLVQAAPTSPPGIPEALRQAYDVGSQILSPLERQGELGGWISVHRSRSAQWTVEEVAEAERSTAAVARLLGWDQPAWAAPALAPDAAAASARTVQPTAPGRQLKENM